MNFSRLNLNSHVHIEENLIGIDTEVIPELNVPGNLTLYGLSFNNPNIIRDGIDCIDCVIIENIPGDHITFTVPGFSNYTVEEGEPVTGDFYYVRAGAEGNNDGSDWTNAYTSLPEDLIRGHTYFIADGNYSSYVFDDAEDGEKYIYVKKAVDDAKCSELGLSSTECHGDGAGWDDSFGDGQAVFGHLIFDTSYMVLNGSVGGGPGHWEEGHGIKIQGIISGSPLIRINGEYRDFVFTHLELEHLGLDTYNPDDGIYGVYTVNKITLSDNYFHDFGRVFILSRYWKDVTIENNKFARQSSSGNACINGFCLDDSSTSCSNYTECEHVNQHAEGWSDWASTNVIIKNNLWEDVEGTAVIAMLGANQISTNWTLFGNIFYYTLDNPSNRGGVSNGIFATRTGNTCNNCKVYNNLIFNMPGLDAGFDYTYGLNNYVYNNLWYNNSATQIGLDSTTHESNWCFGTNCDLIQNEENGIIGITNPFIDSANYNFHLNQAIPGINLSWMNNIDPDGNIRGADGVWDIGVYEYEE